MPTAYNVLLLFCGGSSSRPYPWLILGKWTLNWWWWWWSSDYKSSIWNCCICPVCFFPNSYNLLRPNWVADDPPDMAYELTQLSNVATASRMACTQLDTVPTCIHRCSHILRRPPEPVVWFMSESRAIAKWATKDHQRTLQIISSCIWMASVLRGYTMQFSTNSYNPLRPIGSPVTHKNWPMNWPNCAASPVLLGWPARNRHTAACIHRFSHILRWPPEPVVWFMSESRAVANEHEGYKRTLPIISSSFWMAVGLKGLSIKVSK